MEKPLTQDQIAALNALYEATRGSVHAHVPRHAVQSHFKKDMRGYAADALEQLVRGRYAFKHPTRGEMTYSITIRGIQKLRELELLL